MRQLLNLLDKNRSAPREIRADASESGVTIYLNGVIDADWGIGLADLVAVLPSGSAPVSLYINSPGGDVFEARAMAGIIARHPGPVTAIIEGVAASAATYLAMAAGTVQMGDGSLLMVHNSWTISMGDKNDLLETAALLEKIDGTIAADYARKTGATPEQVTAWMDAETWFTAQEAMDAGFIDAVVPNTQASSTRAQWDLSAYSNVPKPEHIPEQTVEERIALQVQRVTNRLRLLGTRVSAPPHRTAA
jgi:ATP-dependent Clp protease protease subunit